MEEIKTDVREEKPYIKLYKNETAKGKIYYNWEIKLYEASVEEIAAKNAEMMTQFPSGDIEGESQ